MQPGTTAAVGLAPLPVRGALSGNIVPSVGAQQIQTVGVQQQQQYYTHQAVSVYIAMNCFVK